MKRPEWFQRALDEPCTEHDIVVRGSNIHYVTWGDQDDGDDKPGILLVHGSNAHLEWWRFVAPFLARDFRVAALDLSGNGDSGWRERYTPEDFAAECWEVCQEALPAFPYVVGHSFGGFVALETAYQFGDRCGGLIMVDFTVQPPESYVEWGMRAAKEGKKPRKTRTYDSFEAALGRFRLLPDQPNRHPYVLDHIARRSLRPVDGGWTWKFDPSLFDHLEMGSEQHERFLQVSCPRALILGEHSVDDGAQGGAYMREATRGALPILTLPTTHHHLMFDEPIAVVSAIEGIAKMWANGGSRRN